MNVTGPLILELENGSLRSGRPAFQALRHRLGATGADGVPRDPWTPPDYIMKQRPSIPWSLILILGLLVARCVNLLGQTTSISTEYVMTLHAPLDPPQEIDSALVIHNVREGGWVKGPGIEGKLRAPAAD